MAAALVVGTAVSSWQAIEAGRARDAEKRQRLAAQAAQQAEKQARLRADAEKAQADRLLYVANLNLAQQAWEQNNFILLRQLLEETQGPPDRGFEWYYWQRQTHLALQTLRGHPQAVTSVAFSPDGRRIVSGSEDRTAKVWLAAGAEQVAAWQAEERAGAQTLAGLERERTAEQERRRLALAGDEGAIKRWLILAPIPLAASQSGARALDLEQIEGEGQLRPKAGETRSIGNGQLKWQELVQEDYVIDFNRILGRVTPSSVA